MEYFFSLPEPALPAFELIPHIFLDSFVITMVSYTITMSMALIFARKLMYEVDSNQELLALVSTCHFAIAESHAFIFLYPRVSATRWGRFSRAYP